jgi:hypothetical protein
MAAHLHDSHVRVTSPSLEAALGTALAPVYVRMIEGQPVVTHFTNDTLARRGGVQVGDVILSVDGEDVHARMRRLARYISASTPQALARIAAIRMTRGLAGTTVRLRVRRAGGVVRELELTRSPDFELTGRTGLLFRVLPGNIGYADLGRLPASQVDSMFDGCGAPVPPSSTCAATRSARRGLSRPGPPARTCRWPTASRAPTRCLPTPPSAPRWNSRRRWTTPTTHSITITSSNEARHAWTA